MYEKIILLLIIIHTIYPSQLILQSTQDNKYLLHSKYLKALSKYFKNSNKLIKVYLRQIKSSKIFKENNRRNLSYYQKAIKILFSSDNVLNCRRVFRKKQDLLISSLLLNKIFPNFCYTANGYKMQKIITNPKNTKKFLKELGLRKNNGKIREIPYIPQIFFDLTDFELATRCQLRMNAHAFLFLNTLKSDILSQLSLKNLLKLFSDYQKDIKLPRINNKGKISGEEYPNNNHEIYSKLLKAIIIHIKNPIQKNLNLSDICPMFKFFLIPLSFHPHSHEIDEFFHSIEYFIYFYIKRKNVIRIFYNDFLLSKPAEATKWKKHLFIWIKIVIFLLENEMKPKEENPHLFSCKGPLFYPYSSNPYDLRYQVSNTYKYQDEYNRLAEIQSIIENLEKIIEYLRS